MKITLKPKLHNCDRHLKTEFILGGYNEPVGDVGEYEYCTVCKRIKYHIEYGQIFTEKYKPKKFLKRGG